MRKVTAIPCVSKSSEGGTGSVRSIGGAVRPYSRGNLHLQLLNRQPQCNSSTSLLGLPGGPQVKEGNNDIHSIFIALWKYPLDV